MSYIITAIRKELLMNANEKAKSSAERYFIGGIKLYGVITPDVNTISKSHFKDLEDKTKHNILSLCDELWKSGFIEESIIACHWAFYIHKQYLPADFEVFDKWVRNYLTNWASCDTLCNHAVGTFLEMYPEYTARLKEWAKSENRWVKRASAVTLIVPAKKGLFLQDIFDIADILLMDKDDMVQKGYGWMLKAASQAHEKEVFDYVIERKGTMPRTSLRYAIEKMSSELKAQIMLR